MYCVSLNANCDTIVTHLKCALNALMPYVRMQLHIYFHYECVDIFFQMVYAVGRHQLMFNVGRMRVLVQRTFLQGSKNSHRLVPLHVGR